MLSVHNLNAQKAYKGFGADQSTLEAQLGVFGVWVQHELKISKGFVVRVEAGMRNPEFIGRSLATFAFGEDESHSLFKLIHEFTIEPRVYFNSHKKSNVKNGILPSAYYFSLKFINRPDLSNLRIYRVRKVKESLVVSGIGMKRRLTKRLYTEGKCCLGLVERNLRRT